MNKYILIKNGTLVSKDHDSEKNDILVNNEKIEEVSPEINENMDWKIIDAEGKIVSPGFIDMHSHCDFHFPYKKHVQLYEPLLYQGVTTSFAGNCGHSFFPVTGENRETLDESVGFMAMGKIDYKWGGFKEYTDYLKDNIVMNFASLVGHGSLRINVAGLKRELNREELKLQDDLLIESLESGCYGLSTGLMYVPGTFSTTDELIHLSKIASKYPNAIYASHYRGNGYTYIEALKEMVDIGEKTGIKTHISHLGPPFGVRYIDVIGTKLDEAFKLIDEAKNKGISLSFDCMSYTDGNTTIMALFPPWTYNEGEQKFLEDIKDDIKFREIMKYIQTYVPKWPTWEGDGWTDNIVDFIGWENIYILGTKDKNIFGKSLTQIATEKNKEVSEVLREIILEEGTALSVYLKGLCGVKDYNDEKGLKNYDRILERKDCLIGVDALFTDGVSGMGLYGNYSRLITRYVKNKKTITLKDAIERFTNKAADTIGLKNRGYLRKGNYADIVVFDFDKYQDYPVMFGNKPKNTTGIENLLINGKIIIENKKINKILPGKVLLNK